MKTKVIAHYALLCTVFFAYFIPLCTHAQGGRTANISGIVRNEGGDPLSGVSVIVKNVAENFTAGTVTDSAGLFSFSRLPVGKGYRLIFSHVGYEEQMLSDYNLKANAGFEMVISLKESNKALNDVIVVGYGTQRKNDLTGAITQVTPDDLNQGSPNVNVAQMLEGRVAGLYINQHGGDPGTSPTVLIRGNGSLNVATSTVPNANNPNPLYNPLIGNSADPLVIVDGYPLDLIRDMNTISPNDIAEITVLKDASSTAIYGSRGANGVIIITTKSGKRGKRVEVNYAFQASSDVVARELKVMNDRQYLNFYHQLYADSTQNTLGSYYTWPYSQSQVDSILASDHGGTDWQKAVGKSTGTITQSHHLTLSGGSGPLSFQLTGDYLNSYDNIAPGNYSRYYAKSKAGYEQGKLGVNVELAYTYEYRNANRNDYYGALTMDPSQQKFDSAGKFSINKFNGVITNPLWASTVTSSFWTQSTTFIYANAHYEILPGLNIRTNLGLSMYDYQNFYSLKAIWNSGVPNSTQNNASVNYNNKLFSNAEVFADYSKRLNSKNSFTVMVGFTDKYNRYQSIGTSAIDFANTSIMYYAIQAGQNVTGTTNWITDKTLSEFGRLTYNYDDRYLLTANFRADGATQFGVNNKYGYFPSAAVAWRIDRENFMRNQKVFKNLKLRLGYGVAGNDNIPSGLTSQSYSFANYNIGGGSTPTIIVGNGQGGATYAPNSNLKWEQVKTVNIGLDIGISDFYAAVDYYLKNSDQLLLDKKLPPETGHSDIIVNEGQVQNKGIEATMGVTVKHVFGSRLTWNPQFNIAYNKGVIKNLGGDSVVDGNIWVGQTYYGYNMIRSSGQPFHEFEVYHYAGVWQEKEASAAAVFGAKPGDPKIQDKNNDGVIDSKDRHYAGDGDPHLTFGFANRFTYDRFDLSVFFQGVYGNKVFNQNKMVLDNPSLNWYGNLSPNVQNRWSPANPSNTEDSKLDPFSTLLAQSDKYLEDASYFRLKEMVVGYNFHMTTKAIRTLRASIGVTNIFTATKYSGLNPDVLYADNQYNMYPYTRTFTLGVNVGF